MKTQTLTILTILLSFYFYLLSFTALAQAPEAIKYQAVLRDNAGELLVNQSAIMQISIENSSATVLYQETHSVTTNDYGLVTLNIGEGTVESGIFSSIDWGVDEHFINIEVNTGSGYVDMGTTQLLSVPYALHAKTAASVSGGITETDPTWNGTANQTGNIGRTGNVGIGTTSPTALLHTNGTGTGEGNVLFVGEYKSVSPGNAPVSGAGTRMMWYPDKAAFRVGHVTSTTWDAGSTGNYSVAMGYNTLASGDYSFAVGLGAEAEGVNSVAIGHSTSATEVYSVAMGFGTTASGANSTAMGEGTTASGFISTAMGEFTLASGANSTAMGSYTTAKSGHETVVGSWNTNYTPVSTIGWSASDRLFVIGNGTGSGDRRDAMVVLKNGNIGIGTSTPAALLHINNATGSAVMRISGGSASGNLSEIALYAGSTYRGAIGSNNLLDYLYIYHGGNIVFKNGRIGIQSIIDPTFAIHLPDVATDGGGRGRANAWTTYSDARVKSDKMPIAYGLNEIMMLEPVKYFKNNSSFENGNLVVSNEGANDIGFIAQDIFQIIPEIVNVPEDENTDLWGMNYEKITPVLVKAIQEQQVIIETQNSRIENLEYLIEQQQIQISALLQMNTSGAESVSK